MDIIKAFEELHAHLFNLSPLLFSYYTKLVEDGFSEEQAFQMAKDTQNILLTQGK